MKKLVSKPRGGAKDATVDVLQSLINRVEKTEAPVEVMLNWQSQNGIKTQSIEELEAMYDEDEEEEEYNTRRRKKVMTSSYIFSLTIL